MGARIRLFVIDDHALFREALINILEEQADFKVIGELSDGADAVALLTKLRPDIVLMDVSMKGVGGLDAMHMLKMSGCTCSTIMLSMHSDTHLVSRAFKEGAKAYVLKDQAFDDLSDAIRIVYKGKRYVSPELNFVIPESKDTGDTSNKPVVTARERDIIQCISDGLSSKEIARSLDLSVKTVETHRANIYRKLGMHNTAEITRYAIRNGIVSL